MFSRSFWSKCQNLNLWPLPYEAESASSSLVPPGRTPRRGGHVSSFSVRPAQGRACPRGLWGRIKFKVLWRECVAIPGALCSSLQGSTKSVALTSGLRYTRGLSVALSVRYKEFGRRQLTLSCVAICVAVGEKLRNRIRKKHWKT